MRITIFGSLSYHFPKRIFQKHSLILNCIIFQGTVWYSMFKWKVVANLTSSLGYDASCLGNHEFDDGVTDLEAFSSAIQDSYPLLGTIHKITLTKVGHFLLPNLSWGSYIVARNNSSKQIMN